MKKIFFACLVFLLMTPNLSLLAKEIGLDESNACIRLSKNQLNCTKLVNGSLDISVSTTLDQCDDINKPPGITAVSLNYVILNDGFDFGTTTHTDVLINLQNDQYAEASDFTYPATPNFRRRIDFVSPPTNYNKANQTTISISQCPGDFTNSAICKKVISSFTSMRFSNISNDDPNIYCILEPGQSYFMNVINSPDPLSQSPSCLNTSNDSCAVFFTETTIN